MRASPHPQASQTAALGRPRSAADRPTCAAAPAERWEQLTIQRAQTTSTQTPPASQPQRSASRRTCRVAGCAEALPPGYCRGEPALAPTPYLPSQLLLHCTAVAAALPVRRRLLPFPPPLRRADGTPGSCVACRTGTPTPLPHPPPPPNTRCHSQTYRICPTHKTAASFETGGKSCRFCQQCGRVHELAAFDPGRLSCRRSLERHSLARSLRQACGGRRRQAAAAAAAGRPEARTQRGARPAGSPVAAGAAAGRRAAGGAAGR